MSLVGRSFGQRQVTMSRLIMVQARVASLP
jgi:hypothetical protein